MILLYFLTIMIFAFKGGCYLGESKTFGDRDFYTGWGLSFSGLALVCLEMKYDWF